MRQNVSQAILCPKIQPKIWIFAMSAQVWGGNARSREEDKILVPYEPLAIKLRTAKMPSDGSDGCIAKLNSTPRLSINKGSASISGHQPGQPELDKYKAVKKSSAPTDGLIPQPRRTDRPQGGQPAIGVLQRVGGWSINGDDKITYYRYCIANPEKLQYNVPESMLKYCCCSASTDLVHSSAEIKSPETNCDLRRTATCDVREENRRKCTGSRWTAILLAKKAEDVRRKIRNGNLPGRRGKTNENKKFKFGARQPWPDPDSNGLPVRIDFLRRRGPAAIGPLKGGGMLDKRRGCCRYATSWFIADA
ncbi:hypothetical protein B0H11DRAFT_1905996 [Mycena galericulata]|nr:hypothetical protein B0H11DRAFT_1905996 [Mycena galericulata]